MKSKKKIRKPKNYANYPFMNLELKDMDGEEWEAIPEIDDYAYVSNFGRVWVLPKPVYAKDGHFYFTRERVSKQTMVGYYNSYTKDHTERLTVHIRYRGLSFKYMVNRLVYHHFVAPLEGADADRLVVHKDGDNCNNRADNLVLMDGTQLYVHGLNIDRRPKTGLKMKKGNTLIWSEENAPRPIVQYTLDGKKVREFGSVQKASAATGSHRVSIRDVAQKKVIQLHGYVYRYKGDRYRGEHAGFSWEKPVTQFSVEGKKLARFASVKAASTQTGIGPDTISKAALKKFRLGSGYVWRYDGDTYRGEFKGTIKNKSRTLVQYSLDGKKIKEFKSVNQASTETGFTAATLLDCAHKRSRVSHGFVWRFDNDPYKGEFKDYQRGKPVVQYSLEGKLLHTYPSIQAAAVASGLTPDNIQKNVLGQNKTAGGFVWKPATEKQIKKLPTFEPVAYHINKITGREVIQYTLDGKMLDRYVNIAAAAKKTGINTSNISAVVDVPLRSAGGFVWRTKGNRYYGEFAKTPSANKARMVTQYNLKGKKVKVFPSTHLASKETGITSSQISSVARGKFKTSGGFIWQYGDARSIDLKEYYASSEEKLKRISKEVVQYTIDGVRLREHPSIAAAARAEGVRIGVISSAVNGSTKSAAGFIWKLKADE